MQKWINEGLYTEILEWYKMSDSYPLNFKWLSQQIMITKTLTILIPSVKFNDKSECQEHSSPGTPWTS